ncbi:UDP-2,3-diacylglucosamine diphosphatase [Porticoccaceae bacterium]|nr:UDP-2,3-diacylglucosamine diphosphatase [Porticoccaceae bacterium]
MNAITRPPVTLNSLRAVWISDLHLGSKPCKADYLLDFLNTVQCKKLYLVGDIIDLLALKRSFHWPAKHQQIIERILAMADAGTEVFYIPGNHDHAMRRLVTQTLSGVRVEHEMEHISADGRRLLLLHGDRFDNWIRFSPIKRWLGDAAYDFLLWLNWINFSAQRLLKRPYWSLAHAVKTRVGKARETIEQYEQTVAQYAAELGCDGVICGHIHKAELKKIAGTLYLNDGDWVESCTAIVETQTGWFELLHWADRRERLQSCQDLELANSTTQAEGICNRSSIR